MPIQIEDSVTPLSTSSPTLISHDSTVPVDLPLSEAEFNLFPDEDIAL